MPEDRTRRAVLALAAWTAVVAVPGVALSGTVAFWDEHDHLARAASDPAALLASDALTLFLAVVIGTVLAFPLAVAAGRLDRPDTSTPATVAAVGVALAGPVALVAACVLLLGIASGARGILLAVLGGGVLGALAGLGLAARVVGRRVRASVSAADGTGTEADEPLPWHACCWNYWLVAALVVGAVGGGLVGVPLAGAVETWGGGSPAAAFGFEPTGTANGTRLVITHDGGDAIPASRLRVQGDLTAVPGANQARAGRWNGSTTRAGGTRGPEVTRGDRVTVGVSGDCVVRVVREGPTGDTATLGKYDCERDGER